MLASDLDRLLRARAWPAVSVLCGADRAEWPQLIGVARQRLAEVVEADCVEQMVECLERAGAELGSTGDWPAFGVFVNPRLVHAVALPQPVLSRVVLDATFATRDLVTGMVRTPRYLVLTTDGDGAQLWAGLGRRLVPSLTSGAFPVEFPPAAHPGERRHHRERSRARDAHIDRCHRLVDEALTQALAPRDHRPLFVVGDERRIHRLAAASRHSDRFAATVSGDPAGAPSDLVELVSEHVDAELARRSSDAIEAVGAARGANRFAAGIPELWPLAHEGRVELLVVEQDYHQSGVVDPVTGALQPIDHRDPGGIDDAVDEIIEAVLERGGQVEIVPPGALDHWDRIAAGLRH